MKKRIISVLLFLLVAMCLTACGETPSEHVGYVMNIINLVLYILLGIASIVFIVVCIHWHVTD